MSAATAVRAVADRLANRLAVLLSTRLPGCLLLRLPPAVTASRLPPLLAAVLAPLLAPVAAAGAPLALPVAIVVSEESAPYLQAADAFRMQLQREAGRGAADLPVLSVAAYVDLAARVAGGAPGAAAAPGSSHGPASDATSPAPVVAVGLAATRAALDAPGERRIVSLLVPRAAFEALGCPTAPRPDARCTAVFLDQPIGRQLDLVQAALPHRSRVGVVLGRAAGRLLAELKDEAAVRHLPLTARLIDAPGELYGALQAVLPEVDVLLAVPDGMALNPASARSVLVTAYRLQVPVVSASENYVRAGALLAVVSSPGQVGRQGAELLAPLLRNGGAAWPAPQAPRRFEVRVNLQVARSLGLALPTEDALRLQLGGGE